jgi:hypothetical protein
METKSLESEFFDESLDIFQVKDNATKQMHEIAKSNESVDPKLLLRLKDYVHYKGRGWEDEQSPLTLIKCKFPDRVSKSFIRVLTIIKDCVNTNNSKFLESYLTQLADLGINITIDETKFNVLPQDQVIEIAKLVSLMDSKQTIICEHADLLKERGETAQEIGISPKSGFKTVVSLLYTKQRKKRNPKNKIEKEITESDMYIGALEKI